MLNVFDQIRLEEIKRDPARLMACSSKELQLAALAYDWTWFIYVTSDEVFTEHMQRENNNEYY